MGGLYAVAADDGDDSDYDGIYRARASIEVTKFLEHGASKKIIYLPCH